MAEHAADSAHGGHAHSASHYVKIWFVLLVLLAISLAGPEVADNFSASTGQIIILVTAFGIAFYKAYLVVKHFMHLTVEKPIVGYMLITCLVFMVLFFAGTSPDVMKHDGRNWANLSAEAEVERGLAEAEAQKGAHGGEEAAGEPEEQPSGKAPGKAPTEGMSFADLQSDAEKKEWLLHRGEEVYLSGGAGTSAPCAGCHRADGTGHPPAGPPLAGQKAHMGDCAQTKQIVREGLDADLEIDGVVYERAMPGSQGLTDADVAAVATYIRSSWGNDYGICTP